MGKICCCWELGEDYGHVGQFLPVIKALVSRGHDVYFIVKDLAKTGDFEWPLGVYFLQAPLWLERPKQPLRAECYAEIILHKGYGSAAHLKILVEAWQYLLQSVSPDILILDHSPTALLASRGSEIPRLIFSNPFVTPAPGSAPVNLRPWQVFNEARAMDINIKITSVINQVCTELGLPSITRLSDLFTVEKTILSGLYELDFYRDFRSSALYGNSLPVGDGLQKPVWVPGTSIKIFAYLKAGRDQVAQVLHSLAVMQARVVCFYAGARQEDLDRYRSTSITISDQPFDLTVVYREARVVICHAGMGMVYSALHYACPMVLLPTQVEQQNTASILKGLGVASVIDKFDSPFDVDHKLKSFFSAPSFKENAQVFSEKIKVTGVTDVAKIISEACDSLMIKP